MLARDTDRCGWCDQECSPAGRFERHGLLYCGMEHARLGRWVDRGVSMYARLMRLAGKVRSGYHRACRDESDDQALGEAADRIEEVAELLARRGPVHAHGGACAELGLWRLGAPQGWQAVVWGEAEEYARRAAEDAGAVDIEPEEPLSGRMTTMPPCAEEADRDRRTG
jgi:hypothetical protein